MKRKKELVPLSWEHHSALVNANRIKLGLNVSADLNRIFEFLDYVWRHDLEPHFRREEDILLHGESQHRLSKENLAEFHRQHQSLRALFKEISQRPPATAELLQDFAQLLIEHVQFEERAFFPEIEQKYDRAELTEIGRLLKEAHVPGCITWQPPFWKAANSSGNR